MRRLICLDVEIRTMTKPQTKGLAIHGAIGVAVDSVELGKNAGSESLESA
jgi:hypothetical protein